MAPLSVLIVIAILPIALICLYVYSKDHNKEPMKLLLKLFCLGILSCIIVLLISILKDLLSPKDIEDMTLIEIIVYSFITISLVEEFFKWIMVYNFGYKSKQFDQVYDIVVYSVFVSLGFAFLENLLYILNYHSIKIGIFRALSAVPAHACDAIFMGHYLSIARIYKYKNKELSKKNIILSILIPTILHGTYDFCLFSNYQILLIFFFIFIITLYNLSFNKLNTISKENLTD